MGQFVDIHGQKLHMEVVGIGSPTIILECGAGCASDTWDTIWPALTQMTRTVRYDRFNLGQSDRVPDSRSAPDVVTELHTLLTQTGIEGPYLLVGHSFGGLFARLFRDRYPEQVAGLLLLDAAHHEQSQRYLHLLPPETPGEPPGVTALRNRHSDPDFHLGEGIHYQQSQRQVAAVSPLGSLPLAVISRAITPAEELVRELEIPLDLAVAYEWAFREMQVDLAKLSSNSTHEIAEKSGHDIHLDQPELLLGRIRAMVAQLRTGVGDPSL